MNPEEVLFRLEKPHHFTWETMGHVVCPEEKLQRSHCVSITTNANQQGKGRHPPGMKAVEWMRLLPNPASVRLCHIFCWQELKAFQLFTML